METTREESNGLSALPEVMTLLLAFLSDKASRARQHPGGSWSAAAWDVKVWAPCLTRGVGTKPKVIYEALAPLYVSSNCLECHHQACPLSPQPPLDAPLKCSLPSFLEGFSTFLRGEDGNISFKEFFYNNCNNSEATIRRMNNFKKQGEGDSLAHNLITL